MRLQILIGNKTAYSSWGRVDVKAVAYEKRTQELATLGIQKTLSYQLNSPALGNGHTV